MIGRFTRWVMEKYNARRRRIDMDILWPQLLAQGRDLQHAKNAMVLHCLNDPAWQELGAQGTIDFIDSLEAYD